MAIMRALILLASLALRAGGVLADYDVKVELKNLSGQEKTDWPAVLRVYTVFGRDLPAGSVNPEGFHVYDPSGKEVAHALEMIPPDDQVGNDELVFVIPKIAPGQTLTYRITNTKERSSLRQRIDLVGSGHNLITNGGFEDGQDGHPAGFGAPAVQDGKVFRSGKASLMLSADGATVSARYAKGIALHKDSWYYFGVWSKTDNVSRFGYQAGNAAHVALPGFTAPGDQAGRTRRGEIPNVCSTRPWQKITFEYRGHTDWGMDIYAAKAMEDQTSLEFILEQRKHYYMDPARTKGTWWLDDAVFLEQPEVNVRFDLSLKPLMRDGVFLFTRPATTYMGRRLDENNHNDPLPWCNFPYAHENLQRLDKWAMKGQRVSYCIGLYHNRAVKEVSVQLAGGRLTGPDGAELPAELLEYCPGYAGPDADRYMQVLPTDRPAQVAPAGAEGVRYFFLTFNVPRDARAGRYAGGVELAVDGGRPRALVPIALGVQELAQPVIKDTYVGLIHQGGSSVPASDEMLKVYSRSGFTSIMWFGYFIPYQRGPDGRMHVSEEGLARQMQRVMAANITAGCGVYSDVQLDDKPRGHQGYMIRFAREEAAAARAATQSGTDVSPVTKPATAGTAGLPTEKEVYARLIKEADAIWKKHPDWPTLIHMNWDEPPPLNDKMGWTREILPDALVTLDAQFNPLANCARYYNLPAFDNPADWAGPELYRWVKKVSRDFGYCGQPACAEWSRYQGGMLMITTGARYLHGWHLQNANSQINPGPTKDSVVRAISMIAWAEALDDLKCHRLLTSAMEEARKSGDPKRLAAAQSAEEYLKKVFATFNGDHKYRWPIEPYLGQASDWGYERFYDDWQEQMARHAAACLGIKWVE